MTITQTVEIPASHRLTIDVPREVPAGQAQVIIQFPVRAPDRRFADDARTIEEILRSDAPLPGGNARTLEEAMQMAAEKAADPNRKPLSELFGTCKGIFGGDGVAYQRAIRDEWD